MSTRIGAGPGHAPVRTVRDLPGTPLGANAVALVTAALGMMLLGVYTFAVYRDGPLLGAGAVLAAALFLGSLLVLELGIAAIILSMLLSPEFSLAGLGMRGVTLRLEDLLIPLVVLAWIARRTLGFERRETRTDRLLAFMALFVAVQVFSTFLGWGYRGLDARIGYLYVLKQIEYFAIFFFAFQYVDSDRKVKGLAGLALLAAVITALYNVARIPGNQVWSRHRISAPFEGNPEPSSIGGYFVLVLAVLLALALEAPRSPVRHGLYACFGLVLLPFVYTLSRTSYAAFLAMIVVLAWLKKSRGLFAMLGASLAVAPFLLPSSVIDRLLFTFNDRIKTFGVFDRSFGERIFIWYKVYWNMIDAPLLGKGVTYHNVIDSYYARVLIETGLVGLLVFALLVRRLFQIASVVRRRHPAWWARGFALGYIAALAALLLHSAGAVTFIIVRIMEPFWLVSGILAAMAWDLLAEAGDDEPSPAPPEPPPRRAFAYPVANPRRTSHG